LDESAGKRRSTRTRPSAPWLKTTMVQAAWSAARTKDSYFYAQFARLKSRRGPKKAIMGVAASMLTAIYCMLRDGVGGVRRARRPPCNCPVRWRDCSAALGRNSGLR
jgi:hypothetical protein